MGVPEAALEVWDPCGKKGKAMMELKCGSDRFLLECMWLNKSITAEPLKD